MLRDDAVMGVFTLVREEPGHFSPRAIELTQTFADQAVIAIENVRLFDEVQARTRDLSEALEQQTAAAEILRVISSSPTDLQPVFDAIARSASELCEGSSSQVFRFRDGLIHHLALHNTSKEYLAGVRSTFPTPPHPAIAVGRAILRRAVVHIPDVSADPEYSASSIVKAGLRTILSVPMLRNGEPIGAINVTRNYPRPYTDRQIELLKTFADQAVIAINNVGLFNETQEALRQQTATAEVLKAISRSAFDLQTVLDTLVRSAVTLCEAGGGILYVKSGEAFYGKAFANYGEESIRHFSTTPQHPGRETAGARILLTGEAQNIADTRADPEYETDLAANTGYRALLGVPLVRDETLVGAIVIARPQPGAFGRRQVELVQTFADQAVIAIQNVRQFNETQEALERQTATAEILRVIAGSPSDTQPVFDAVAVSANRLLGGFSTAVWRFEGDTGYLAAFTRTNPEADAALRANSPVRIADLDFLTLLNKGEIVHLADTEEGPLRLRDLGRLRGYRAMLFVPLISRGAPIGFVSVTRKDPGAFAPDDVQLLQTFADQAVIAIQNTRLFDETQEALQQQTATADVLKVISRSAFDLQAVLDTLVESAVSLIEASSGVIWLRDGEVFNVKAVSGAEDQQEFFAQLRKRPQKPGRHSIGARVLLTGEVQIVGDIKADPEYDSVIKAATNART